MRKVKTIDVPQADSLKLIRSVVEAAAHSRGASVKDLSQLCGFSERHVRYRIQAARVLGLMDDGGMVSALGRRLLRTDAGSPQEKAVFRDAVSTSAVVQQIAPELLTDVAFDTKKVASRIAALSGLSAATAERRAVVIRAWRRDLADGT